MTKEQWDAVLTINLDGVFNVTKQVVEGMTGRGWGRIINISSINGQKGQLGQTNYTASKAGMHGFTKSLAQEVARQGVTVNTVSPGTAEEVAALVDFIASDEAGFATGADFSLNGGQHMM